MRDFTKLSEEEIIKLLKSYVYLREIPKEYRTEKICEEAVKVDGYDLEYVVNQTKQICLEAIKQNPWAIVYVNNDLLDFLPNIKFFRCKYRNLLCEKIDDIWLFTIGCQYRISKDQFINRIYDKNGGLEKNPHRKEYLKILEQF